MCTLFLASLTAAAQVSRDMTAPPKAVAATAAPVMALAPRKPRRLRPPFTSLSFCLSLMGFAPMGTTLRLSRTARMRGSGFSYLYSGNQLGRVRSSLLAALLALVDQRRTLVVVVV